MRRNVMPNMAVLAVAVAAGILAALAAFAPSSSSPAYTNGVVDQSAWSGNYAGADLVSAYEPIGQSFVPSAATLVGVDLVLEKLNPDGTADITLRLREGSIDGPVLGSATRTIPEYASRHFEHFDFPSPLTVTPGSTYVIELDSTNNTHAWTRHSGDVYPSGAAILDGMVRTWDYWFQTCTSGAGTPCGPFPTPTPAPPSWCSGGICQEWVARYHGPVPAGIGGDEAADIAVDGLGNAYVTGRSVGSGTRWDYATIKYGPDGSQQWAARYDDPNHRTDEAYAIALGAAGNVYVTGSSEGVNPGSDYATVKYGPDGSELWVARYDGPPGGEDKARAIAVDGAGNVYVTGWSEGVNPGSDYVTIKYGPDGSEQWVARYDGLDSSVDRALAIAVDEAGNVYVTGFSFSYGIVTVEDYITVKYGPDGSELWVARYDGPDSLGDSAVAMAMDVAGNVYVTGWSNDSSGQLSYATVKYGPDGSQQWAARYNWPGKGGASAIAVDRWGNVYVTGSAGTVKYGPDGTEEWAARYDGPAENLGVDAIGNAYVTGSSEGVGTGGDYTTVKYGPDGSELWVARYDGPASAADEADALAVDATGNVYVTGRSQWEYATIKYSGALPSPTPTPTATNTPTATATATSTPTATPTPLPPVGGIVGLPALTEPPAAGAGAPAGGSGWSSGAYAALAAVGVAAAASLAAGGCYARRRWLR